MQNCDGPWICDPHYCDRGFGSLARVQIPKLHELAEDDHFAVNIAVSKRNVFVIQLH
jgi:hypothetical protein